MKSTSLPTPFRKRSLAVLTLLAALLAGMAPLGVKDCFGACQTRSLTGYVSSDTSSGTVTLNGTPLTSYAEEISYANVTTVTLEAVPAPGYRFTGWTGSATTAANPVNVTIDCALTMTAVFVPLSHRAYICHITQGDENWNDFLQVDNLGSEAASYQIVLYDADGNQVYLGEASTSPFDRSLIDLKAMSADAASGVVHFDGDRMLFRLSEECTAGGGIAEFMLPDTLGDTLGYFFSDFTDALEYKGLALTNFSAQPLTVTLTVYGKGLNLGSTDILLGPNQKVIGTHDVWFPAVDVDDVQLIQAATTAAGLGGIALTGDQGVQLLVFTPAMLID